jgi:adenosylcobinamide-GDP ribazoletransferase
LAALSFLTVLPATRNRIPTPREISNSRAYYPAVGLLFGLLLIGLERGCREVFPIHLTAAVLLVALIAGTRGLHLDGLMDVCDGLFGGYTRERRLEIMRDPRVGAFGIAGAAALLLLKYGALVSLLSLSQAGARSSDLKWPLLLFPMLSRWSMVVVLGAFPYARSRGLASPFHSPFHQGGAKWATSAAAAAAAVASVLLGGTGGAAIFAGVSVLAWLVGRAMAGMLGGLTGDTYGAINEIAEVAVLMAAVAALPHGWIAPLALLSF